MRYYNRTNNSTPDYYTIGILLITIPLLLITLMLYLMVLLSTEIIGAFYGTNPKKTRL